MTEKSSVTIYVVATIALIAYFFPVRTGAVVVPICSKGTVEPGFPEQTLLHLVFWDLSDELIYTDGRHTTLVVTIPNGVTVVPNPRADSFAPLFETGNVFAHGLTPTPIPAGTWSNTGTTVLFFQLVSGPVEIVQFHPDNPFACASNLQSFP